MKQILPYEYIAIEGNIGAGKTSLARMLAADLQAKIILEEFEENPFLPAFYKDPEKYGFQVELTFLADRFQQLRKELLNRDLFNPIVVSDYFLFKSLIFAKANLETPEFFLFDKLFGIMSQSIPHPDLLVFLHAGEERLKSNIRQRGRPYEQNIDADYLGKIHERYLDFLKSGTEWRCLIIHTAAIDFVNRPQDFELIRNMILREYPPGVHIFENPGG
jgi:deoxyadenosine/deoxycytidine kinase